MGTSMNRSFSLIALTAIFSISPIVAGEQNDKQIASSVFSFISAKLAEAKVVAVNVKDSATAKAGEFFGKFTQTTETAEVNNPFNHSAEPSIATQPTVATTAPVVEPVKAAVVAEVNNAVKAETKESILAKTAALIKTPFVAAKNAGIATKNTISNTASTISNKIASGSQKALTGTKNVFSATKQAITNHPYRTAAAAVTVTAVASYAVYDYCQRQKDNKENK